MMLLDRRRFLLGAAGTLAVLPAHAVTGALAATPPTVLVAGRRTLEVNGKAATVLGIAQPDGTPGLVTTVGTPFRVTVRNEVGADTLIHWHGLTPPYRQDGVPGISGPPIAAGGTAGYDFPLAFPGTFFMHSHEGLQEQSLLGAPLIVREREADDRQEVVLMLHDFSFRSPQEIFAGLRGGASSAAAMPGMGHAAMPGMRHGAKMGGPHDMAGMEGMDTGVMDLNDVAYDALLANDRTLADPAVVRVEAGGRVRLRIINAAAASNFSIDLGARRGVLVAVDGHPVTPVAGSIFPIAVAQRIDVTLDLPPGQVVVPVLATLEGERRRTGIVLATAGARIDKVALRAERPAPPLDARFEASLRATVPLPPKTADRTLPVALTGSMRGYVWGLDGRVYGQDRPLIVRQGERVELAMTNRTGMSHPMHLHGHVFQVVAIGGRRFAGALRDTVLVPPKTTVTVAFDADNPGVWAFHCHNLYHMEAGMMTTLRYAAA